MPYDRMFVGNQRTGEADVFNVRISRESFMEWMDDRATLKAAGFPDRPPDVDTDTVRIWVKHPGEENDPFFAEGRSARMLADDVTEYPVYIAKWEGPDLTVRVQLEVENGRYRSTLSAFGDGAEHIRWPKWVEAHDGGGHYGGGWQARPRATDDDVWAAVMETVAYVHELRDWPESEPSITTYVDILAIDAEVELAEADAARGFTNPLPEGRVQ